MPQLDPIIFSHEFYVVLILIISIYKILVIQTTSDEMGGRILMWQILSNLMSLIVFVISFILERTLFYNYIKCLK
jgi:hypothetical protein